MAHLYYQARKSSPRFSRKFLLVLSVLIFIILVSNSAYKPAKYSMESIRLKVEKQYLKNLESMSVEALMFNKQCLKYNGKKVSIELLKTQFQKVRADFKRVEFLAEYLDQEFTKDFFNGSPLPRLGRNSVQPIVLQPQGLQVLEELLYNENPDKGELVRMSQLLADKVKIFSDSQKEIHLSHRQIIEACRTELIRIFSLGVTGFDTPGSENSISDAAISMASMQEIVDAYSQHLEHKNPELNKRFVTEFNNAISYLSANNDFDSFDRLYFLKEFINPLYRDFLKVQLALNIETGLEAGTSAGPVNYTAENIFDNNFFNAGYYTSLSDKYNTKEIRELGKLLFFDPVLSDNSKRSCASCHNPDKGFTDGLAKSIAFDGSGTVSRNSPSILNAALADRFFYDMRATKLDEQIEHVMVSPDEFNFSFEKATERLMKSRDYTLLFSQAYQWYKGPSVSKETITLSLSAYMQSLVSFNSAFDKYIRDETIDIEPEAIRGFNLFMGKAGCGTCHFAPTFSGLVPPNYLENESEVLGVPETTDTINAVADKDEGRYANKRIKETAEMYRYSFKTPTVRNAGITGPYMHNGVFKNLNEVLDFYNRGGGIGLGFHMENQTLPGDKLNLSKGEIRDIISFIQTLTDTTGLTSRPKKLPVFENEQVTRLVGGEY